MTYRISATTLEAYRLFLSEDWMDYDRLPPPPRGGGGGSEAPPGRAALRCMKSSKPYKPNGRLGSAALKPNACHMVLVA